MPEPTPYKVAKDGTVYHRAGGHVIGRVRLVPAGWLALGIGDARLAVWNTRSDAARAVWRAYSTPAVTNV